MTTYNLAAALAERGRRVLMVDLDAQAGLTVSCGLDPDDFFVTTYDLMAKDAVDLEALTVQTKIDGVDLFPANLDLTVCRCHLADPFNRHWQESYKHKGGGIMKALAVFPSSREVRLIDQPEPMIAGPTEVKLRILEAGICGTDREITSFHYGTPPVNSPHLIIGHEALGEVIDVGSGVTGLAPGDLAVLTVRRPCPHDRCGPCRNGRQDFCITEDFTERGIKGAHGYMTEFVVDDERYIVKVPRELCEVAVLIEPLTVAEKAAEQARVLVQRLPGDLKNDPSSLSAVVLGAGPIGLLGAMKLVDGKWDTWVYSRGEADSPNVRIVSAIGARFISSAEHPPADLAKMVGNISLVYEATGAAKMSFDVLSVLGVNGVFLFTGVPGVMAPVEIDAERIMRNLVLNNQVICGTVNAGRASFEEGVRDLVSFMRRFPDAVRALITARVALDDARDTVLSRGGIKSVITVA